MFLWEAGDGSMENYSGTCTRLAELPEAENELLGTAEKRKVANKKERPIKKAVVTQDGLEEVFSAFWGHLLD